MTARVTLPKLHRRFERALVLTAELHRDQVRKGTDIPYVSHLMAVTALVLEDGGDENVAIAALLHDAVEDQGGEPTLRGITETFGDRVAGLVAELSEDDDLHELPWLTRKRRQLDRLADASPDALRIKAADTLHNVQGLVADWNSLGARVWDRFSADSCALNQLWHYGELLRIVSRLDGTSALPARLNAALEQLRALPHPRCHVEHEHPAPS